MTVFVLKMQINTIILLPIILCKAFPSLLLLKSVHVVMHLDVLNSFQ